MSEPAPPSTVVLDASAAIALIRSESDASSIAAFLNGHQSTGGRLVVPDHFWIELANVFIRRYAASPEDVVEVLREIDELGVESIGIERALVLGMIDLQHHHRLSAYDAMYLALAQAEDSRLLTLDARLAEAAGERAIRLNGRPARRVMEQPAAYAAEPIDWARFGPYLAQLRAEARDQDRAAVRD